MRYDRYSDVGSKTNPRVSLRWLPSKDLLMRASAGTGRGEAVGSAAGDMPQAAHHMTATPRARRIPLRMGAIVGGAAEQEMAQPTAPTRSPCRGRRSDEAPRRQLVVQLHRGLERRGHHVRRGQGEDECPERAGELTGNLPEVLRDGNPQGIWRRTDGVLGKA